MNTRRSPSDIPSEPFRDGWRSAHCPERFCRWDASSRLFELGEGDRNAPTRAKKPGGEEFEPKIVYWTPDGSTAAQWLNGCEAGRLTALVEKPLLAADLEEAAGTYRSRGDQRRAPQP